MVARSTAAEPAVLARVAAGDDAAVREAVARFGGLVWALARRFEPRDAEDAVQEIFLDLWRSAGRYDPAVASEVTFVAMIARRRLIDRRRHAARRPTSDAIDELPALADQRSGPEVSAEAALAAREVGQLRPEQREVLMMATCQGLTHQEIADATGMPLGTVKAHARRGLMSVRARLFGAGHDEESP